MTFFHAIILGLIEGVTEFLPVSSTAHLSFAANMLHIPQTEFLKTFIIVIQFGAILSVCVLFFKRILKEKKLIWYTFVAFIPTAIIGFLLYRLIKHVLIGNVFIAGVALVIGGIAFLVLEYWYLPKRGTGTPSFPSSFESIGFGLAQAVAVIPGVSRSGAVIVYGLLRGYSREVVTIFAFLLAVPTMFAAGVYDLYKTGNAFSTGEWELLLVGVLVSFFTAYIVSRWFIGFISKHSFKVFGWYRIIIGGIILIPLLF